MKREVYLAGAVRTAIGTLSGALEIVPAPALGSAVAKAALQRAGVELGEVDELIFGNVLSAGLGQNVARQVSLGAGLDPSVPATTVNKVCGSGLKAVTFAAQAIQCGDAELVLAGGGENMSRSPYLLEKARQGYRLGNGELIDSLIRDGLWDVYNNVHIGTCGDRCAAHYQFTREQQDDYAIASFERAFAAANAGITGEEILPLEIKVGKETHLFGEDESPKRFNAEKLRKFRPAFGERGTVTAGNTSSINDGAAALVVLSKEKADLLGIQPQARILGYACGAREPEWFTTAPVLATQRLLKLLGCGVDDIDLFEINEAFAVVPMAAMRELSISHDRVNVLGGAVALGHPIGASGARTLVTLINALRVRGVKRGIDTLCVGGGEGIGMAIEAC